MNVIDTKDLDYREVNERLRAGGDDCELLHCRGQRFICADMSGKTVAVRGTPGNALGAYMNGARITVYGNAHDAVGETMNDGRIAVHGDIGDTAGYAMRGGQILIRGSAGYRAGIHMKAYKEKAPLLVIGGTAGSFLGEYQAGGVIVVLGLERGGRRIVGNFPCTGMHGGKMILRCAWGETALPPQVTAHPADAAEKDEIRQFLLDYCAEFAYDIAVIMNAPFTVIEPDSANPYRQMYVAN